MIIQVARIPEEGEGYEGDEPGTVLDAGHDPLVREAGAVHYRLRAQRVSGELVVRGTLSARLALRCARCAEIFWTTVVVSDFLRAYPAPEGADPVDLSGDFREEVLLHAPCFARCNEDCKGICVRCGADLNTGSCGCGGQGGPENWAALDGLGL